MRKGKFLSSASASVRFPGARPALLWSQFVSSCPWYFGITNALSVLREVSDIKVVTVKTGSEPQGTVDSDLSPLQLRFRSLPGTSRVTLT